MDNWPLVAPNDDGIRPAGPRDACFYCRQKVGQPHKPDCVHRDEDRAASIHLRSRC
jgi:hypothetical protein